MQEITFVRHAESTYNVEQRWQGQGDAPLSPTGRAQARRFAARLASRAFDCIVSSDLSRAADTAGALGRPVQQHADWREINLGRWEGLTPEEVAARYPGELIALQHGHDVRIGGGESWADVEVRARRALDALRRSLPADGRALVVTHGGVIVTLVSSLLGVIARRPRVLGRAINTSLTTLRFDGDAVEVAVYNDASHLVPVAPWVAQSEAPLGVVTLFAGACVPDAALVDPFAGLAACYATPDAGVDAPRAGDAADLAALIEALRLRHPGARVGLHASPAEVAAFALAETAAAGAGRLGSPRPGGWCHVVASPEVRTFADWNVGGRA